MKVIKRDGRLVDFNSERIRLAILKAKESIHYSDSPLLESDIANSILDYIKTDEIHVEEIQDFIVAELMQRAPVVAEAYESYRKERNNKRNEKARKVYYEIIDTQATDITRENANMNADTPAGQMMKFASETTKSFTNNDLLSADVRRAYVEGRIHIHDED